MDQANKLHLIVKYLPFNDRSKVRKEKEKGTKIIRRRRKRKGKKEEEEEEEVFIFASLQVSASVYERLLLLPLQVRFGEYLQQTAHIIYPRIFFLLLSSSFRTERRLSNLACPDITLADRLFSSRFTCCHLSKSQSVGGRPCPPFGLVRGFMVLHERKVRDLAKDLSADD